MRPLELGDFIGQEHLLGPGSALRTAIETGQPHSMILYGPPGTGKTTLARIAAAGAGAAFEEASAVNAGRAEVREVIARAEERRRASGDGHDLLPRRDPPIQQGTAGRAAARGRGGAAGADRGDHREPVLRGQLGPALALPDLRAAPARGGPGRRAAAPRAAGSRARHRGSARGARQRDRFPGRALGRRRPRRVQRTRAGRRDRQAACSDR